ncbi:MAG: hypothetical protein R3F61_02190 [Myxococcota bacterium]
MEAVEGSSVSSQYAMQEGSLNVGQSAQFSAIVNAAGAGGVLDASDDGMNFRYRVAAGAFYGEEGFRGYCSATSGWDPELPNAWESVSECILPDDELTILEGYQVPQHPYDLLAGSVSGCSGPIYPEVKNHFRGQLMPATADFTNRDVFEGSSVPNVSSDGCDDLVSFHAPDSWYEEYKRQGCKEFDGVSGFGSSGLSVYRGSTPHTSLHGPSSVHNYYGSRSGAPGHVDPNVFDYMGRAPVCVDYIFKTLHHSGKSSCLASFTQKIFINCASVPVEFESHPFVEHLSLVGSKERMTSSREKASDEAYWNEPLFRGCPDPTPLH